MFSSLKKKLFEKLEKYDLSEFARKASSLDEHLGKGLKVVDVGCGSGRFARFLQDHFGCSVTGVDVINYLAVDIPFQLYKGDSLDFEDKSVDVVLCMAVIHHTPDPEATLKELHRIAKKVILIEDYCATSFGKMGLHLNDYFTNIIQNAYKCWSGYHPWSVFGMQWRLRFKTERELRTIFERNGMKLIFFKRTQPSWKGMSHGVYLLE